MRLGIADHFGWAVAVTASADHEVVDRRRIELIEPGVPSAPIHHDGESLDDAACAVLVAQVRASAVRATSVALDEVAAAVPGPIVSMSLRAWSLDFPEDIATQRSVPYESRADSVMYRQVLADLARARGWEVDLFDAKDVEARAVGLLGERAEAILRGPRAKLGPPWAKDHRMALAATIVAGARGAQLTPGRPSIVGTPVPSSPGDGEGGMDHEVVVRTVAASPTAVVAAATTWQEFPSLWGVLLDEVYAVVRSGATTQTGHNVMLYRDGVPNVEVGVEVDGPFTPSGRVVPSELPAGRFAVTVHRGPYDGLGAAHEAVLGWCRANDHETTGLRWELYGDWREDPAELETEVAWLLAPS